MKKLFQNAIQSKSLWLFILVLGYFQIGYGQSVFPTGLILDDAEYQATPHASQNIQINSGQKFAPRQIDLTPFCPEVRHQGDIQSCVGWSAGYAAMTIERAIKNGWKNKSMITAQANSALFVYNHISNQECMGIKMTKALQFMQEYGNCMAKDFDNDPNDCSKKPLPTHITEASAFKIEEYIRLFDPAEMRDEKVKNVKLVLAQKKPVLVGMKVLNNFYSIRRGTNSWIPTVGDQTYAGGHAMVVVGYNDHKFNADNPDVSPEMKGAFKLMNSWGKNWGEAGFIWIRYAHFAEYCRHAYAIMISGGEAIDFSKDMTPEPASNPSISRTLGGTFGFKQFTGQWHNDKPIFQEEQVALQNNYYVLPNRRLGDQFQLNVQSDLKNGYIYVFSVDPEGKSEIHFPKSAEYDQKFENQNESALLLGQGSRLTIPSQDRVLTISHLGKDHLVVLFSEKKIKSKYIQYLGKELSINPESIAEQLPRLLKNHMIPFADIIYHENQMGFAVNTASQGRIVPIILQLESH